MFAWDSAKATRNFSKHGVSFEEAATIFADPKALDWAAISHSQTEHRFKRLGKSFPGRILLAVYTVRRLKNEKETIRIISAPKACPPWRASRKERKAYAGFSD